MRIERFQLDAFGRLADLSSGPDPLPGLVVLLGPNEAGKSTVFHFLTSMLYGFYPASRDAHPYAPWGGADPGGSITVRLDAGGCAEVERRLMSQPSGRMTVAGRQDELRNRTLPWAEHVPRAVFHQVYAVTLAELAGLDEDTWGRVQDRIVGAMGTTDIRSARQVVAELEQEAGELWRPNRRGNQRIRDLRERVAGLRERRHGAAERDRRLREIVAEAEALKARLHEAREARQRAKMAVDRVQALVPIRTQLRRIDALREDAGDAQELAGFPADPGREVAQLREHVRTLRRRLDELEAERADPQASVSAFGEAEQRLLERGEEVTRFLGLAAGLGGDRARLAALDQETRDLDRRFEAAVAPLFAAAPAEVPAETVTALPLTELRRRVLRVVAARDELRILEAARAMSPAPAAPAAPPSPLPAVVALVVGLLGLGAGLATGTAWATAAGAVVTAVGAALLGLALGGRERAGKTEGGDDARRRELTSELEAAEGAVAEMLAELGLRTSVAREPDEGLVTALARLQELLRDRNDRRASARGIEARTAEADAEASRLATTLGQDPELDAEALSHLLDREVRRAARIREAARSAERELARLDRERARVTEELSEGTELLDRLTRRLEAEGDGDAHLGAQRVRARLQAAERADQLQEEMERAHADLEEIRARIRQAEAAGDGWTMDDDDLARRKARVEELTEEVETLATRAEALDRDAAHLREAETMDAVDGAIAALQEEEQALLVERDRRFVLARLLRQADRRFREEHQPDLMRRAGAYMAGLTGGRYERIVADESAGNGRFQLVGPGTPTPIALAPPISTGTLEQTYLALRLAIVDHLDRGLERLPLFVDEVFVNWDQARRARGLDLLADVSSRRQVFAFTCHPAIASELEARGATVLPVGRDG